MTISMKAIVTSHETQTDGEGNVVSARVHLAPDYADGRNKEWAYATPNLSIDATLNGDAAGLLAYGDRYTVLLEKTVEEPVMSTDRPAVDNPFVEEEPATTAEEQEQDADENVERNEQFKESGAWEENPES